MAMAFIHIPEQHTGSPVALGAVLKRLEIIGTALLGAQDRGDFRHSFEEVLPLVCRSVLFSALSIGATPAFVQSSASGRWLQIPQEYWDRADMTSVLPFTLEPVEDGIGLGVDFIDQPIVMWDQHQDQLVSQIRDYILAGTKTKVDQSPELRELNKKRTVQVAEQLDAAGIAKRSVTVETINGFWKEGWGDAPKVDAVRSQMGGRRPGRPGRE